MIYTHSHGPAIPVVDITISLPDDADRKVILRALVDLGADGTVIPVRYLWQLGQKWWIVAECAAVITSPIQWTLMLFCWKLAPLEGWLWK